MGQSTDGILFYGYCWEDEGSCLPVEEDYDPEDDERWDDEYEISESAEKKFGVRIGSHCSCEYPMPYIYIVESETTAWRGSPMQIDPNDLSDAPLLDWNRRLLDAIKEYNLDISEALPNPGWFLVSNWC